MKPLQAITMFCFMLLLSPALAAEQLTVEEPVLGFDSDFDENQGSALKPRLKPAKFDSFYDRLDFVHCNLQISMNNYMEKADTILDDGTVEKVPTPPSRFRLTPYLVIKDDEGIKFSLDPDFEMKVDFPNLEKRLAVFMESSRRDVLPGIDPSEKNQVAQIGLRNFFLRHFEWDIGVKVRWPPIFFTGVEWNPRYETRFILFEPRQRVSFESDDGFGSLSSLTTHHWFGTRKDMFWQSVSAARYTTRSTDGVEMEQTFKLGWIHQSLESRWSWKDVPGEDDLARGQTIRYSLFGHLNSNLGRIDRHRLTYTYRHPLYQHWIYLEVAPGVEATDDNDWKLVPSISVAVDMLFWGTYER